MDASSINAMSTAVIAFITVIATMVGFYYNLQQVGTKLHNIIIWELVLIISIWAFIKWINERSKKEQ